VRRRFKERKAISVLVSNVLMLLIVVVVGSVVFAYVDSYVTNYHRGSGAALQERLLIEDVWFKQEDWWWVKGDVQIAAYNFGKIATKVVRVFINGESWEVDIELGVGEQKTWEIDLNWKSNDRYDIKLLTETGYSVEGTFTSP
jgi:hypothetical protein